MLKTFKQVTLRCDCRAENLVFSRYDYSTPLTRESDFDVSIEDSYCGGDFMGIKGRFRRAWHAFFAKPIVYSSVYIEDKEKIKKWLEECLALVEEDKDA